MKKIIATLLGILTTTSLTHQVFAVEVNSNADYLNADLSVFAANPLDVQMNLDNEDRSGVLIINGKEITIKSTELKIVNNNLMVPLKSTAESLGFKVTMNNDSAEIDNDEIKTTVTVGDDLYYYESSHAEGMTAPESLGTAPIMENGNIYVPIKIYNLLYNDSKAVGSFKCIIDNNKQIYIMNGSVATGWNKINDEWYYMNSDGVIKTGWIKDNNNWYFLYDNGVMAADTVTPDGYKVDSSGKWDLGQPNNVQIPSPIVEYKTVKEAAKAASIKATLPSYIPQNYKEENISVISNKLLQILYKNNDSNSSKSKDSDLSINNEDEILLRMGKFASDEDISGDYNIYEKEEDIECDILKVNVKENKGLVYVAEWSKDDMRYSISISNGMDKYELLKIINSMR